MIKLHLDVLLDHVLSHVQPQEPQVHIETGVGYCFHPVTSRGGTYCLYGDADYILRYDDEDKAAVKLVVVRAKKLGFKCCGGNAHFSCCGPAQVIALMGEYSYLVVGGIVLMSIL